MPADAVQLGAMVTLPAKRSKPVSASSTDSLERSKVNSGLVMVAVNMWTGNGRQTYRCHGNCLHIGNSGGASEDSNVCWKWRLQARLPRFTFQTLDQCLVHNTRSVIIPNGVNFITIYTRMHTDRLFTTNVCPSPPVHVDIKVITRTTSILSNESGLISFMDRHLHVARFVVELSSDVDVSCKNNTHSFKRNKETILKLVSGSTRTHINTLV